MELQNMKAKRQAAQRSKTEMTSLEQEIEADRENLDWKGKYSFGKSIREGQQRK